MAAVVFPGTSSAFGGDRAEQHVYIVRRLVAVTVAVIAAFALVQALSANAAVPSHGATTPAGSLIHIVQPGESLWSIARTERPKADLTRLVDQMMRLNGGSTIQVGQALVLPD